jgi:putative NADH-flavin reductase
MKIGILGATGRTGRHLVDAALAAGHEVKALVRNPSKLTTRTGLQVLRGDVHDAASVRQLVEGCDVVASALGPTRDDVTVCSTAAQNVIAAGARRYVAVSGMNIDLPEDRKDLVSRIASSINHVMAPAICDDKRREYELLAKSGVKWTLVRPPMLLDRPARGRLKTSLVTSPGARITRGDLAAYVLRCCTDESLVGKAPFVSG